ncbi:hypothetical protein CRX72_24885 [Pantoea sp. BRM17]|nr:hypothetical protein CRX72_24885 [Pantoea sp. BRM17]
MDFNILTVRADVTLATVQRFLRKRSSMPNGTDKIFITNAQNQLGALWQLVPSEQRGRVLVEASETVWESLTEGMSDREILRAIEPLDIDDQVYLARYLSRDLTGRLLTTESRQRILSLLLSKQDLVDVLLDKSVDLNAAELREVAAWRQQLEQELAPLHAADLADILEALPEEERPFPVPLSIISRKRPCRNRQR